MPLKFVPSNNLLRSISFYNIHLNKIHISCPLFDSSTHEDKKEVSQHYDVIISGGGMVGFAAGCALGQSCVMEDKQILLLEKQAKKSWSLSDEYSNRVCALNSQTQRFFSEVGAWQNIKKLRAQPVKKMQVWESCSEAMITFDDQDIEEHVAHIVENDVILDALKRQIPKNVKVEYGSDVKEYNLPKSSEEKVNVILQDGQKISTDLLIGADGAHSGVRKAMNCKHLSFEYDQMGIVATLELDEEQDNFVAWQKFLSTGPIAILPLSPTRSSLVWSTRKSKAKTLLGLSDQDFVQALNAAMWQDESVDPTVRSIHSRWQNLLQTFSPWNRGVPGGRYLPPSIAGVIPRSRASFPLGLGHAAQYVAPRVALIGDAAHRTHPLAGQGVNLGFGDVVCLRDSVQDSVRLGCDV
ncbi:UNVERIFIED_CONTAM: hypothetical protein GTU68_044291, partial [Idotea baltica]|nr:hypothetical protein [Idotea baltica]